MANPNVHSGLSILSPAEDGAAVTPHDTTALARMTKALYIGGAGTGALKVRTKLGNDLTFAGLTANTILPIQVDLVYSTGTGVTNIVALF